LISDRIEYCAWDFGGDLISNEQQGNEYFSSGTEFGLNAFLKKVRTSGVIYVVNVCQDIEYILHSKAVLHSIIYGNGMLKNIQLRIVFNE
jgi:hypothetical protein